MIDVFASQEYVEEARVLVEEINKALLECSKVRIWEPSLYSNLVDVLIIL